MKSTAPSPFFPARRALLAALLAIAAPLAFLALAQTQSSTSPQPPNEEQTSPFARVDGTNIYVYKALTPEKLAEMLVGGDTKKKEKSWAEVYLEDLPNVENPKVEFGQTREQLKKLIEESYKLAVENVSKHNLGKGYPLNKEQLNEIIGKIAIYPIMLQEYNGRVINEDEIIYLTPIKKGNIAYISIGIITEPDTKLEEDPYCDYEILLESTIIPETGEIKETEILPKEKHTYNTPYNKEGIEELEEWGYDVLFGSGTERIYYGTGHKDIDKNLSKIKSYIVGCIIKKNKNNYIIYFSPPTIWHIHPGGY